jgi:ABC-type phosphate transport system permease subunit
MRKNFKNSFLKNFVAFFLQFLTYIVISVFGFAAVFLIFQLQRVIFNEKLNNPFFSDVFLFLKNSLIVVFLTIAIAAPICLITSLFVCEYLSKK